jgi:hypothetical protein
LKNKPISALEANIWINNGETEAVPLNDNIFTAPKEKFFSAREWDSIHKVHSIPKIRD